MQLNVVGHWRARQYLYSGEIQKCSGHLEAIIKSLDCAQIKLLDQPLARTVGKAAGFSLHAGVVTRAHEREKLDRLCPLHCPTRI